MDILQLFLAWHRHTRHCYGSILEETAVHYHIGSDALVGTVVESLKTATRHSRRTYRLSVHLSVKRTVLIRVLRYRPVNRLYLLLRRGTLAVVRLFLHWNKARGYHEVTL